MNIKWLKEGIALLMKHLVELLIVHLNIPGISHRTGVNIKSYDFHNDAQGSKDMWQNNCTNQAHGA